MADIDTLLPDRSIEIHGETVHVAPFKFAQIPRASALIAKYTDLLSDSSASINVVELITQGGEDIFELMCLSTQKDRAWIDTLGAEEGIDVLTLVIEVNYDFFTRKLVPLLQGKLTTLSQLVGAR